MPDPEFTVRDRRAYRLMTEAAALTIQGCEPEALEACKRWAKRFTDEGLSIEETCAAGMRIFMGAILLGEGKLPLEVHDDA